MTEKINDKIGVNMKIAICDDQKHFRDSIKDNLKRYHNNNCNNEKWEIHEYSDGNKLISEDERMDLYILDLEMPSIDGIEVAASLQKKWENCNIIIMTTHIERMKEGYRVNAFRYMTKPVDFEELKEGLDTFTRSRIGYEVIELKSYGTAYQVQQREIRYVCKESGDTVIYSNNNEMKFRSESSMEEWENLLNDKLFFRCHKGYIVNLKFIEDVNDKGAFLDNGEVIPVSRRKKNEFKDKVREFDLMYGEIYG
ncbi:MAG: response regulator transcription factor [Lachnospiraceae bacterium]|nr:response regulator transcription factor [Lachnospiraceae bacterium]